MSDHTFTWGGTAAAGTTTATGYSDTHTSKKPNVSICCWLSAAGGTATVLARRSNDATGHETTLGTLSLSGVSDVQALDTTSAFDTIRLEVTAISGGAVVAGNIMRTHD